MGFLDRHSPAIVFFLCTLVHFDNGTPFPTIVWHVDDGGSITFAPIRMPPLDSTNTPHGCVYDFRACVLNATYLFLTEFFISIFRRNNVNNFQIKFKGPTKLKAIIACVSDDPTTLCALYYLYIFSTS